MQKAKASVIWLASAQFIQPGWEFAVGIVLARMLTPRDFGIIAMGMIFFSFASAVSNLGIGNVIIQKKNLIKADVATAQSIATLSGLLICSVLFYLSMDISIYFKEPLAGKVLSLFSLNFVINGINLVPAALLSKKMRFKIITIIDIFGSFVYGFSALFMAYSGYGLFSLVYSQILAALFKCVAVCFAASYIPKFGWNKSSVIEIIKFGGTLTLASMFNYAARNADYLIIGKFLGAAPLGLYKRAYDLAVIPKEKVADTLNRLYFSFVCKTRDDKDWTKSAFLKISKAIALISMPVLTFSVLSASEIIRFLYGQKWLDATHSFQFMVVGGIFYSITVPFGSILIAYGRSKIYLMVQVSYSILLIMSAMFGVNFGIEGVAIAVSSALAIFISVNLYSVKRIIDISLREYLCCMKLPLCISLAIVITTFTYEYTFNFVHYIGNLAAKSIIAAVIYSSFFLLNKDMLINEMRNIVKGHCCRLKTYLT